MQVAMPMRAISRQQRPRALTHSADRTHRSALFDYLISLGPFVGMLPTFFWKTGTAQAGLIVELPNDPTKLIYRVLGAALARLGHLTWPHPCRRLAGSLQDPDLTTKLSIATTVSCALLRFAMLPRGHHPALTWQPLVLVAVP